MDQHKSIAKIRILLADDHKIVRQGICAALEDMTRMKVVAEAENGRTALGLSKKLVPDVVIMDISMPDMNGIEATRQIKAEVPSAKIIALSMYSGTRYVLGMLKAGVSGYLIKDCVLHELASAIDMVCQGGTYLSPKIATTVLQTLLGFIEKKPITVSDELSNREREVLQLIAEGIKTKDIATYLHLSPKTVETYRRGIIQKLKINSIAELTKFAIREGLTPP
ncbi:MAG: response regulator transcription factor [Desulfobacterales bacterium]|nr:response regulator transcription factor [Desulfobacterales bacterium]